MRYREQDSKQDREGERKENELDRARRAKKRVKQMKGREGEGKDGSTRERSCKSLVHRSHKIHNPPQESYGALLPLHQDLGHVHVCPSGTQPLLAQGKLLKTLVVFEEKFFTGKETIPLSTKTRLLTHK